MSGEDPLDRADALLARARAGHDVRAEVAALPAPLRGELEELLAAEAKLWRAIGAGHGGQSMSAPPQPRPSGAHDPWPGRVVSGYRLERLLGRGGMAAAYLASGPDGRQVVVKLLAADRAPDPHLRARLGREAAALRRIRAHPNLIAVLAADLAGDPPHLVLELAPGAPLRAHITQHGRIPPIAAMRVARDVARGLAVLHGHGLLHRDVKPENIVVGPDGNARLIDLGIAKDPFATALTQPGQLIGTAEYMAPEQWTGGAQDARTDVFALGATLYFALCGRPPFTGTFDEIMDAAVAGDLEPPSDLVPDCPPDLERIVLHALAPSPRFRYARMEPFAHDLERVARGEPPVGLPALVEASGRRHALVPGWRFVVGSDAAADVRLAGASPRHAEVRRDEDHYTIVDLKGSAGTSVGGARITRATPLEDGELLQLGPVALSFADPGARRRSPPIQEDLRREERPAPHVDALIASGDPRALAALLERLAPDPLADRAASELFHALAPALAPRLLARREEHLARERAAAPALLERVSGERLGADPVAWLGWWFQARGQRLAQTGVEAPARALSLSAEGAQPVTLFAAAGEPGVVLIGRDERCHLRIDHPTVSRLHATVLRLHRRLVLRDEGGAAGTTLDGGPAHVTFADPGAALRLGDVPLIIAGGEVAQTTTCGARVVEATAFEVLVEARHPASVGGHVAVLDAARAAAADGPGVGEAWRARASRAHASLVAWHGRDLGVDPATWRTVIPPGPAVAPAGCCRLLPQT